MAEGGVDRWNVTRRRAGAREGWVHYGFSRVETLSTSGVPGWQTAWGSSHRQRDASLFPGMVIYTMEGGGV